MQSSKPNKTNGRRPSSRKAQDSSGRSKVRKIKSESESAEGKTYKKKETLGGKTYKRKESEGAKAYKRKETDGGKAFRKKETVGARTYKKKEAEGARSYKKKETVGGKTYKRKDSEGSKTYKEKENKKAPSTKNKYRSLKKETAEDKRDKNADGGDRRTKKIVGSRNVKPQRSTRKTADKRDAKSPVKKSSEPIRLNRYIANSGVCSRREADTLITEGAVTINGSVVTTLGSKVAPGDKVQVKGKSLKPEKFVYVLLNKPKDFITTTDDPYERKTVMQLVKNACDERIYPVGRLDRNTTGLLLFTNDGELSKRLSHPRYQIKKIYQVKLDRAFEKRDFETLLNGIDLKDGNIRVDELAYAPGSKDTLGIALHSGRNRIVRRMFEHLGYRVMSLDRVYFAGLTKKEVPRGKYRLLKPKEISMLKMVGGKRSLEKQ